MSKYDDRRVKIGGRIKEERDKLGLTQKEFLTKIYKSEQSTKSLSSWEKGDHIPDLDSIALMAELFNCDIGYLLCDYDERNRDTADIVKVTGLSEPAANRLRDQWIRIKEDESAGWTGTTERQELTAIDTLLEGGKSILWNIYQYIYGDYGSFSLLTVTDGEGEKSVSGKEVTLCNDDNTDNRTILQASQMQSVFLLQTQEELAQLRYRLHPPQRDKSGTKRSKNAKRC